MALTHAGIASPPSQSSFITIVSGLPRSGTSMMMQMLAAGGIPALTDSLRAPDEDNPKGYFELEEVKSIKSDKSWLEDGTGKAVKIITVLLPELPSYYNYRVILMRRDAGEILNSQKTMLKRRDRAGAAASDENLKSLFVKELADTRAWAVLQPNLQFLEVDYAACLGDPLGTARSINAFLGGQLITARMAQAVEPSLYRNRQLPQSSQY